MLHLQSKRYLWFTFSFLVILFLVVSKFGVQADTPNIFTGCISTNAGLFYSVKLGTSPFLPCPTGDPQVTASSGSERYQAIGTGITGISPASTWLDIPNASISGTFRPGQWKATYTGSVLMTGEGTAYIRLEIRPTGGSPTDLTNIVTMEHLAPPSSIEGITQTFTFQSLIDLPAGEVHIVPQVYSNNTNWYLLGPSTFILEQ